MRQFIPFEDDWDLLETLGTADLIPYRTGLLDVPDAIARSEATDASTSPRSVEAWEYVQSPPHDLHEHQNFCRKM